MFKWLDLNVSAALMRPFICLLFSCVTGAYLGFYCSDALRTVSILLYSVIILVSLTWRTPVFREILVIFMSVIGFAVFTTAFIMWKSILSDPQTSYFQGNAKVISVNASNDGVKSILLRLETGEKVILKTDSVYDYGDELTLRCTLKPITSHGNPGDFDVRAYYFRKGIVREAAYAEVVDANSGRFSFINIGYRVGARVRRCFYSIWLNATDDDTAALLSAVIVGDDSHLTSDVKESFKKSNLSHILVVSGAHVGYFSATVGTLCSLLFKSRKKMIMIAFSLILFGFVTGWGGSASRSILTYIIVGFLSFEERAIDRLSACALSALIIMVLDPFAVFSWGILLSFGATFSIMLFQQRVFRKVRKRFAFFPNELCTAISCFVCAQIGMLPVLFCLSGTLSINSVIVVIFAGFPSELICSLGFVITVICMALPAGIHRLLFSPVFGEVRLLKKMADFGALDSFGRLYLRRIPIVILIAIVCFFLSLLIHSGLKRKIALFLSMCSISGFVAGSVLFPKNHSYVYFLDVGQGDSALVVHNGYSILIDGGNMGNGETIQSAMDHLDISRIDIAFISHLDTDHISGILELWQNERVNKLYASFWGDSSEMDQLKLSGLALPDAVDTLKKGNRITVDQDLYFEVLWPESATDGGNDDSMVLLCALYDTRILFTGDISENVEKTREITVPEHINVLKVAHHGSRFSTSDMLLNRMKTDAALISVGYNHYGHPSKEVLDRLRSHKIRFFRTDERGCVVLKVTKDTWQMDYYF
ncbi:MAG: DNA internalization-related competence protein ComEC/Rec2 [Clostridiales bacterium]|nr:DNA internalization-related competence protein ComEC/Rec2 [Clostridiales bacterium]